MFGLVGSNGAGKTTTIKILMNILKPNAGHAEVFGIPSRQLGPQDLERIGYVSENQEMPDRMTVGGFLAFLKPFYPIWDDARAEELVRQFDLPPGRKLRDLSRGMRMKASLASSLAYRPRLLVLDEPFSGLDPLVRDELIEGILEGAADATIFVSSHELIGKSSTAITLQTTAPHSGDPNPGRVGDFPAPAWRLPAGVRSEPRRNPEYTTNPAVAGSVVAFWGTGFGPTDPPCATGGLNVPMAANLASEYGAELFDGMSIPSVYAGSAPTLLCGVEQINVRLPTSISATSSLVFNLGRSLVGGGIKYSTIAVK